MALLSSPPVACEIDVSVQDPFRVCPYCGAGEGDACAGPGLSPEEVLALRAKLAEKAG